MYKVNFLVVVGFDDALIIFSSTEFGLCVLLVFSLNTNAEREVSCVVFALQIAF